MKKSLHIFFTEGNYWRSFMLFSFFTHVLAAIVSTGYHHADEHFQILEPIGWKLGFYGAQDLAWEFTDKIRPGLQISGGYLVGKILLYFGLYNPFILTATLRQLTGLLWWALTWLFYKKWCSESTKPYERKALLLFTTFLWFLPYLHVRYSSESLGGLAFFAGLYVFLYSISKSKFNFLKYVLCGLFMGLGFYFRFQMSFAIIGFLIWLVLSKKLNKAIFFGLATGGALAISVGTLTDYWLYGEWAFTPYNYFFQNIIEGKAAGFGVSPFYSYVTMFIEHSFIPLGAVLLLLLGIGLCTNYKSPFTWVLVAFVLGHSVVGHKEFRFMFPMVALLPYILTKGFIEITHWKKNINSRFVAVFSKWFVGINCLLIGITMLKPASEQEALFKAFYIIQDKDKTAKIAFTDKDPFDCGLQMNFFRYCENCFYKWEGNETTEKTNYIYTYKINDLPRIGVSKVKLKYSTAPIVGDALNIGNWLDRTNNGYLWQINYKTE